MEQPLTGSSPFIYIIAYFQLKIKIYEKFIINRNSVKSLIKYSYYIVLGNYKHYNNIISYPTTMYKTC